MTTRQRPAVLTSRTAAEAARDRTEDQLTAVLSRAMRKYLAKVEKEMDRRVKAGTTVLTAAGQPLDPITLGQMYGWWADTVDTRTRVEHRHTPGGDS